MQYFPLYPPAPLGQFVETVFHLAGYTPEHAVERIVPDTSASLVIELDDQDRWVLDSETAEPIQYCRGSWVSGPHRDYFSITARPQTELIGVRFRIGGLYPLLRAPIETVLNQVLDARDLFGDSIADLRSDLLGDSGAEQKVMNVTDWLVNAIDIELAVPGDIQEIIDAIYSDPSSSVLKACVDKCKYSQKHLIHLFRKHTGYRPRELQRILKFSQALAALQDGGDVDWATFSHECGYADQSHFIRDFKRYSGFTPTAFRATGTDRENFIPLDHSG